MSELGSDEQTPSAIDIFVRAGLDRLRLKLLDLTTRNPLISFRHSWRARRYIRVIDELPNQLFQRLEDEIAMRFKSLGRATNEPEDEKTVQFRRALAAAKLEDPEYRERLEDLGDEPGEKAVDRLEEELRLRLREQVGMPARQTNIGLSPADVARKLNLNPTFDLPVSPAGGATEVRHSDSAIQTLLFEDDMQLTLGRIREVVRLSIGESGVNPLFCVFGFLEWYEDTHSEVALHAPLLLCPLSVERKVVRGQYQYMVQTTGEETQLNVALVERLKRDFDIVLPQYDEGETPESYFTKVQQVVERMKGWKVRRWVTVGLLSFARIAMYHDLAPEGWAPTGGLENHEGLRRLIGGGGGGGNGSPFSRENEPTAADGELSVPLIADADSSQLAALKDVLSGRNLVIEGPPGTGKSQTITNLIAAAMAEGKTVLFLAEKMAALNVVRDRLKKAGLDDFCLQLHSTKAGRKETAAALARRLGRDRRAVSNHDLDAVLSRLTTLRDGLARCVDTLGRPAGKLGITIQELLWRCHAVRQQSRELPSEIDELVFPAADELTEIEVGRIASAVEQFERAHGRIIDSYGSVAKHPWNGIASHDIDPVRAEDIVRRVRRLSEAAGAGVDVFEKLASLTGVRLEVLTHLSQVGDTTLIDKPDAAVSDEIVARMSEPQTLAAMEHFAHQLQEYARIGESVAATFESGDAADSCPTSELRAIAEALPHAGFGDTRVADVPAVRDKSRRQADAWRAVSDLMATIAKRGGWTQARTPAAEHALLGAVELATAADAETVAGRAPLAMAAGAVQILRQGAQRASHLKQRRAELGGGFELSAISDAGILRRHALAIRSAPALPLISPAWWRARRAFFGLAKERKRIGRMAMARSLNDLATYFDENKAYAADEALANCAGLAFQGIDTEFTPILRVAEWADRVRASLPAGDEINHHLRHVLLEGPADQIESLAAATKDPQMATLRKVLASGGVQGVTIETQAGGAAQAARHAQQISDAATKLRLKPEFKLSETAELEKKVTLFRELRESLDLSETAKSVLEGRFEGHRTSVLTITACAAHVRRVDSTQLPVDLRKWLLSAEATGRLEALRTVAGTASSSASELDAAVAELRRIADVDFKTWLRVDSPLETRATDLREHAKWCADDPEGFQALIENVRTRREVADVQMQPLLELLEARHIPLKNLACAARRIMMQSMARDVIVRNPSLANFSGDRHEGYRREFRELDHKLKRLRQQAIAGTLLQRQVDPGVGQGSRNQWTDLVLIQNEAFKQKGHVPVRDLMERAGRAMQQLMPCFMMSPLSVAQYLKPGKLKFDLIVMDEASQLRPEDAIGAIGRASQIVVVGDPKQLPPTNFFREADGTASDDDDDNAADEQSILDQALSIMRPARRLKWHYRSRHASLIAFSNKEFYESQLVVFPSPFHDHPDFGVSYVHIPDGVLRSRVNVPEAKAVARAAIEYAARHPDRSLGIVTLNQPQAELLSLEIDRLAAEHEEFEAWRQQGEQSLEPFFVKNLENVQGDERDAIFISTVYGPDEPGKREFAQRFGPINNQGGHRRLNVLFTRAKCQMTVFSSMDPADMRTDENSPWGVRALKGYLKFAKDGVLDLPRESGRGPESDFEVAVIEALEAAGFEVVPQVGVVGYFIDLAIRHPNKPGEFVLGVECDGATYHSSKSARDRDRLRQEVLERLKWRIHRIWSLDWYRNSNRETERLLTAVRQAIASAG